MPAGVNVCTARDAVSSPRLSAESSMNLADIGCYDPAIAKSGLAPRGASDLYDHIGPFGFILHWPQEAFSLLASALVEVCVCV